MWPGLTSQHISRYYQTTTGMAKGHLSQEQKKILFIKTVNKAITPEEDFMNHEDHFPTLNDNTFAVNHIMCSLRPFQCKDTGYEDITG